MSKKQIANRMPRGRPSDYSDELADEIILKIQSGMTLFEISELEGFPAFRTLIHWRRTKPNFCALLEGLDEDHCRDARRSMRQIVGMVQNALTAPKGDGEFEAGRQFILANIPAANFVTAGFERIAKVPVMKDVVVIEQHDEANMRETFDRLHPMTQDKIRQALIEDQSLRGEEEGEEA